VRIANVDAEVARLEAAGATVYKRTHRASPRYIQRPHGNRRCNRPGQGGLLHSRTEHS
jgi:hypothetical protein